MKFNFMGRNFAMYTSFFNTYYSPNYIFQFEFQRIFTEIPLEKTLQISELLISFSRYVRYLNASAVE
jgi:hypothetical protein